MDFEEETHEASPSDASASRTLLQQMKTRQRRGSLRKIALLGRGAQREQRENRGSHTDHSNEQQSTADLQMVVASDLEHNPHAQRDVLGLGVPMMTSGASPDALESFSQHTTLVNQQTKLQASRETDRLAPYNSTTDEDDILQSPEGAQASILTLSDPDGYFRGALHQHRRSISSSKSPSPLSYSGISSAAMPPPGSGWDYSETEWWGWVVLCVTWFVFVIGMGSCLDIWSWAWDIGKTPYAPPELENDPTLPIVGYYPTLIILTGVMAWVWVVVAWVGMKYFRHAKISGD